MNEHENLTLFESRVLFLAPEVFAILNLLGSPRPYDQDSVVSSYALWKSLDDRRAREVLGWGFCIQRIMGLVPSGLAYPKRPLWKLPHCKRTAYLKRFRDFHRKKGLPLPEFFKKIDTHHGAIAAHVAEGGTIQWQRKAGWASTRAQAARLP
jgi:hypothetical protein